MYIYIIIKLDYIYISFVRIFFLSARAPWAFCAPGESWLRVQDHIRNTSRGTVARQPSLSGGGGWCISFFPHKLGPAADLTPDPSRSSRPRFWEVSPPKPGRPPRASPAPRERRDERREERREEAEGRRSAGARDMAMGNGTLGKPWKTL
jgi:hypothetical protein